MTKTYSQPRGHRRESALESHEKLCAFRYEEILRRINRLEMRQWGVVILLLTCTLSYFVVSQ